MYKEHVPLIRDYALQSPENMTHLLEFVLATIQQGLSTVPMILDDIDKHGSDSVFLFGSKRDGYNYIHKHAEAIHEQALYLVDPVQAVKLFYSIPGIGAVKAGFCAQLLGHDTGCIDSHNLKLLGIKPNAVNIPKSLKAKTLKKRLHDYVDLTLQCGGAQYLWDSWCNHVAGNKANKSLTDGFLVSRLHVECIIR